MAETASVSPLLADEVETWDYQADVVVVGFGIAGVCASLEAARSGADVLVLERTGGWGGAAAMSGGFIYLGGGTALQRKLGFEDTAENMEAFLTAALGPGVDKAKIHDYCQGSVEHFDWLVAQGVPFNEVFWGEPGYEPPADEGLMFSGGENAAPFKDKIPPAPRGHLAWTKDKKLGERGGGYMLMEPLAQKADELGVRHEYDVRMRRLIVDETGRVVGVAATRYGKPVHVRAEHGVVLATGSFAYNHEMVEQFAPKIAGRPAATVEEHDGIGIRVAQALGADLAHMDATEVALVVDPQLVARGILVNGHGQRFITEDTYPGRMGQAVLQDQDNKAYLVIDELALEEAMETKSSMSFLRIAPTWVAETVAELEGEMGLPEHTLQSTIDLYNHHAAQGNDPFLNKKTEWVKPIRTPLGAYDLRGYTGGFTLGGLRTDLDSRVLHVSGEPIPGLYAAGRVTSGICAGGYASGCSLGDGSFFGRRAGVSAAKQL